MCSPPFYTQNIVYNPALTKNRDDISVIDTAEGTLSGFGRSNKECYIWKKY